MAVQICNGEIIKKISEESGG